MKCPRKASLRLGCSGCSDRLSPSCDCLSHYELCLSNSEVLIVQLSSGEKIKSDQPVTASTSSGKYFFFVFEKKNYFLGYRLSSIERNSIRSIFLSEAKGFL